MFVSLNLDWFGEDGADLFLTYTPNSGIHRALNGS
jgi:hypothetical protein